MDFDGHSGINHTVSAKYNERGFQLILTASQIDQSSLVFTIHANPNFYFYDGRPSPESFLQTIGYAAFRQGCPYYHDSCLYYVLAKLSRRPFADMYQTEQVINSAERHAKQLRSMYDHFCGFVSPLETGLPNQKMDLFPELQDKKPHELRPNPNAMPDWMRTLLPETFRRLVRESDQLKQKLRRYREVAGLCWETGDALEQSVKVAFDWMGFPASKAPASSTYDLAVTITEDTRLLVEVTGLTGALKKDTPKAGQCFTALQQAQPNDRVLVLANTFRELPPDQRSEPFTPEITSMLKALKVILVTGVDLFAIWKLYQDSPESSKDKIRGMLAFDGGVYKA